MSETRQKLAMSIRIPLYRVDRLAFWRRHAKLYSIDLSKVDLTGYVLHPTPRAKDDPLTADCQREPGRSQLRQFEPRSTEHEKDQDIMDSQSIGMKLEPEDDVSFLYEDHVIKEEIGPEDDISLLYEGHAVKEEIGMVIGPTEPQMLQKPYYSYADIQNTVTADSEQETAAEPSPLQHRGIVTKYYGISLDRKNSKIIIKNATAYPFRLPKNNAVCVFCGEAYDDPKAFREHMKSEHETFNPSEAFRHVKEGFLKVDITELHCRICGNRIANLEDTARHLNDEHNLVINFTKGLGLQPYIMKKDKWSCAICNEKFTSLRTLSRHTAKHFPRFTCNTCGKTFATSGAIRLHETTHENKIAKRKVCRQCQKIFTSTDELRVHMEESKKCCMHVCNICDERFVTCVAKDQHTTESHAIPKKTYPCPECNEVFLKHDSCRTHFKICHTDDCFKCSCCGSKFVTEYKLKRHMVTHIGEKIFECDECMEAFSRKSTLAQHMWIHQAVKKWRCSSCDKQFNQRVTLKKHTKTHHPEMSD